MAVWKTISTSVEMTEKLGEAIGAVVASGDVITLDGDLGAGKTAFTRGLARGMGLGSRVTSPTFTIVQEYETGRLPLYHFDVYRVNDEDELFEIGLEDYFHKGGVCLIEWADLIEDLLPEGTVTVRLAYGEEEGERICSIER